MITLTFLNVDLNHIFSPSTEAINFYLTYCVSKKKLPILYSNFLYKLGNYFLDI